MPKPKKSRRKFTDDMIARFRIMWADGWSQKNIADLLGVTPSSLSSARARYNLPPRDRNESAARKAEKRLRQGRGIARKGQTLEVLGTLPPPPPRTTSPGNRFVSNTFPPGKQCQFIDGHPRLKNHTFCSAQVTTPGPYCDEHRKITYLSDEEFDMAWRATINRNPRNM